TVQGWIGSPTGRSPRVPAYAEVTSPSKRHHVRMTSFLQDLVRRSALLTPILVVAATLASNRPACAQEATAPTVAPTVIVDSLNAADRFWISGQANAIAQLQPSFEAKYSGPNSLSAQQERASSSVLTMYGGVRWTRGLAVLFDVESVGGGG